MKPFLLITGMHRSGTSFLARALNLSGVYLGNLESMTSTDWDYHHDNLRGHWENKKFLELADKILLSNNGSWENVPEQIQMEPKIGQEIKNYANKLMEHPSLASGFKDPRIILCLDVWLEYLPKNFIIVGIFRDPLKVAESLKKRNGFSYEKSLHLWQIYNEKLLFILEKYGGFLLNFDWSKERLFSELSLISTKLGLDQQIDLSEWFTDELLHSNKTFQSDYTVSDKIKSIHLKLLERSENNNKIIIEKFKPTSKEINKIISALLTEIHNQGIYFKNICNKFENKIQERDEELDKAKEYVTKITREIKEKDEVLDKSKEYVIELTREIKEKDEAPDKIKEYITKLTREIKERDEELDKAKEYVTKITREIKEKDLNMINQTRRKYYSSRL